MSGFGSAQASYALSHCPGRALVGLTVPGLDRHDLHFMIHGIVHTVATHPDWAYATLFLAAMLEAVPVIGSVVPGSTIILSLSALVATGDLDLAAVLASTIFGALLGDGGAFWLGHINKGRLDRVWPFARYPQLVQQSRGVFEKYGSAAVIAARFLPPVRAFVPAVAGAFGMPPRRFYPRSVIAIALWAPAHVLPGVLAGTAYHRAGAVAGHLALPFVIGVIAIALAIWAYRRRTAG
jgi:membrane protein DedA with SNARE-associated domain